MNPNEPRLLPDFAAVPTCAERAGTRRYWQAQQSSLTLDCAPMPDNQCAACAGDHETDDCPHGTALTLS